MYINNNIIFIIINILRVKYIFRKGQDGKNRCLNCILNNKKTLDESFWVCLKESEFLRTVLK